MPTDAERREALPGQLKATTPYKQLTKQRATLPSLAHHNEALPCIPIHSNDPRTTF